MARRVPASMRMREFLSELIDGRVSCADGGAAPVKLPTRLIVEEALEAEILDAPWPRLLRARRVCPPGLVQRSAQGASEDVGGFVDYAAPQIAGRDEPFRSEIHETLKDRTQAREYLAVELPTRGLSVRDIKDAFRDESGRLLLSRRRFGVRDRRAVVGGLPGVDRPRSVGVRHRLSVRRRHRRPHPRPEQKHEPVMVV